MRDQQKDHHSTIQVTMLGVGLDVMGGIASVEKLILENAPDGAEISHISTFEYGSAIHKISVFSRAIGQLVQRLTQNKVDLIHLHFAQRGSTLRAAILTLIVLAFRKPIVLHAHGSEFKQFYAQLPALGQRFLGWLFQKCDRFIVLSDSWKHFYTANLGLHPDHVAVLLNPVSLPAQVPVRADSGVVNIVFLGRIGQRKGAFDLINAFAMLPDAVKRQARLTLAGDGEVDRANQLVNDLKIAPYVTVLSWVGPAERDALLEKAHAFILPSYNEGLPMALLEAMGWGLAAITTPVGGIPEMITDGENGLLVSPGHVDELAAAMQAVIENPSLRVKLATNARESVAPLDVNLYRRELLAIYRASLPLDSASSNAIADSLPLS